MNKWISFKEQLPPVGEKILVTRPGSKSLGTCTLMYALVHQEDTEKGMWGGATEGMIKSAVGYWMTIPKHPEDE